MHSVLLSPAHCSHDVDDVNSTHSPLMTQLLQAVQSVLLRLAHDEHVLCSRRPRPPRMCVIAAAAGALPKSLSVEPVLIPKSASIDVATSLPHLILVVVAPTESQFIALL